MHRLAVLYHKRGNYEKAERLYQEVRGMIRQEKGIGQEIPF